MALPELLINGHSVANIRVEQTYKGNFHLLATIDGKERKFVVGKNKLATEREQRDARIDSAKREQALPKGHNERARSEIVTFDFVTLSTPFIIF
ncbi:MAG: hypothetical protein IJV27_08880 [Prevotella sp.]|nr:hypothetical protein [Prevotella sp.]